VEGGESGLGRYRRFGMPAPRWHLGKTVDGTRAAQGDRLASPDGPLSHEQAASTQITLRVHGEAKQSLAVKVNGRKAGKHAAAKLEPGWQTLALQVDPGHFVVGENQLTFETTGGKSRIAVAWVRIGVVHPPGDDDPRAAASFDAKADAIELAQNAEVAWYVTIPDGAHLVADVAGPCHVQVNARAGDDSLTGGLLDADTKRVDLSPSAGKVV